ncbi:hypothetical protein [Dickeya undicola]|nr:hypothetical protein [Dickeya undicola]
MFSNAPQRHSPNRRRIPGRSSLYGESTILLPVLSQLHTRLAILETSP